MLRISEQATSEEFATLLLEGEVVGVWVAEVRDSCERLLAAGRRVRLDLSGTSYVSRDGLLLLRELRARAVEIVNASLFLNEQLKDGDALKRPPVAAEPEGSPDV